MSAKAKQGRKQPTPAAKRRHLKLLSFNIQAGSSVETYRHYFTRGWQHVLPHPRKARNLAEIATLAAQFDLVALQEVDAGSLRTGFTNQMHYLAEKADFPYWSHQPNRRVGPLAETSNGLLSRIEPSAVIDHKLPGAVGRGALEVRFGDDHDGLRILIAHLSLTPRARREQFDYLSDVIADHPHVVLMGDLNCTLESGELKPMFSKCSLRAPRLDAPHTFPSWAPQRAIDHIILSEKLKPKTMEAVPLFVSDHLPIATTVVLPESCRFDRALS
jgi:endonuclease/exonuclease/phosphatase family metal-dependent hydrolase